MLELKIDLNWLHHCHSFHLWVQRLINLFKIRHNIRGKFHSKVLPNFQSRVRSDSRSSLRSNYSNFWIYDRSTNIDVLICSQTRHSFWYQLETCIPLATQTNIFVFLEGDMFLVMNLFGTVINCLPDNSGPSKVYILGVGCWLTGSYPPRTRKNRNLAK